MSDEIKKYDPWDPKGHLSALHKRMEENDRLDEDINIEVFFAENSVDPGDVMAIAVAMKKGDPFGLKCDRSYVIFVPEKRKGYWLWSDLSPGPVFEAKNDRQFAKMVKLQFITHRTFVDEQRLVLMCQLLNYGRQLKELGSIPSQDVSQPSVEAGPVAASDGGIQQGRIEGGDAVPEPASGEPASVILCEPIRDAKVIPFNR